MKSSTPPVAPAGTTFVFSGLPERLDRFLARSLKDISRARVQRMITENHVTVDGRSEPSRRLLNPGEKIEVTFPPFTSLPPASADSVPILFEDDALIVVNKPAGLVVHPAGPHRDDTLIQRLWPKLAPGWVPASKPNRPSKKSPPGTPREGERPSSERPRGECPPTDRPGVVHRLDRGTTGVMVIAKTPRAAEHLALQFAERKVKKTYWAVVEGLVKSPSGKISSMVGRSKSEPHRMSTTVPGRWSETEFTVLQSFPTRGPKGQTVLEARPRTGRTHQIRVQMAALGHPLVGDSAYGATAGPRPLLHAHRLEFTHPTTNKPIAFTAPAPPDFASYLSQQK